MNTHVEILKTGTVHGFKVYCRHASDRLAPWRYADRADTNQGRVLINLAMGTRMRDYSCHQEVRVDTAVEAVAAALKALEHGLVVVRIAAIRPVAPEFRSEYGPTFQDFLAIGELMALAS